MQDSYLQGVWPQKKCQAKQPHRCFRQGYMPLRQAHRLLLIFWYIKEFVYKDTISIDLHTIIKEIPS